MTDVVNVVVTCTKDKRQPIADECELRNVLGVSISERIQEWQDRTNRHWQQSVRVADLYAGDLWANVRALGSSYFAVDIWVCSAGYGLIHYDDHVAPYAATFSRTHPDSVAAYLPETDRLTAAQNWWKATASKWKKHFGERPRSLADLMAAYPKRSLLVVASDNYMRAITDDLRNGVANLDDPDQLAIISAGIKNLDGLDGNLVPCDARMQSELGGARNSLNMRLAVKIIRESRRTPYATNLRKRYQKILDQQPPIARYNRQQLSDDEIRAFIRKQLRISPNSQHSPLLRILRDSNIACEQKRFKSLYKQVVEAMNG
jgi:hypothetical protein